MKFNCFMKNGKEIETWDGTIESYTNYGTHVELYIQSRSSIRVLVGKTSLGNFACIPDWNAGCHLIELSNQFWNTEKLITSMGNKVDAITVASALYTWDKNCNLKAITMRD